jgi:hypothetical protein
MNILKADEECVQTNESHVVIHHSDLKEPLLIPMRGFTHHPEIPVFRLNYRPAGPARMIEAEPPVAPRFPQRQLTSIAEQGNVFDRGARRETSAKT